MKNTKAIKIITVALSFLLLIGAIVGISVSAANEPTVSIKAKNLAYEGAIQVLYAVDAQNVPDGAKVQMYFYDEAPSADSVPSYTKDAYAKPITIGDVNYPVFFSHGIAPKNMRAPIFAKAVIVDGEGAVIAASEVSEYSVFTYATNRFSKSPSEDQLFLYTAMLDYGASVQNMLVETEKMTEKDVIDNGGWINAYCGIRKDITIDGKTVATGEVKFYAPDQLVDISAANSYENGVFNSIKDAKGNVLTGRAYPKASVVTEKPGVSVYTANYDVTGYTFRTFDDLCIDGSENDVNVLHKGKITYDSHKAIGAYIVANDVSKGFENSFGREITDTYYTRITTDTQNASNQVFAVGGNGTAGNTAVAFKMDDVVGGADKYVAQFDLNYHGRTDGGSGEPIYFRIENFEINDVYDIRLAQVSDNAANSTFTFDGITLNKNQKYTIRYEITPINRIYYDLEVYIDGVLMNTLKGTVPDTAQATQAYGNIDHFLGIRFFNRKTTNYSYELDNVYVGTEGEGFVAGEGKYASVANYNFNSGAVSDFSFHGSAGSVANGVYTSGHNSIAFRNNKALTGEKYVYETDFRYERGIYDATLDGDHSLGWFGLGGSDSRDKKLCFAAFYLPYAIADGKISYVKLARNDGTTTELARLYPETWYNIRIEYTPTNTTTDGVTSYTGFVEVYVNGAMVASYNGKGYAGSTTITNEQFTCAAYEFRGTASKTQNNKYIFDNTYISAESVNAPVNGAYYSNADYAGTRYDGTSVDILKDGSGSALASHAGVLDLNASVNGISTTFAFENVIPEGADALPEGNVHVFETDIRFDSAVASDPGETLAWFGMNSTDSIVKEDEFLPFYISVDVENGEATALRIRNHSNVSNATVAVIPKGEWHNLRFVYTANNTTDGDGNVTAYKGNVEVFLDNVSVSTFSTTGYHIGSDTDNEPNNVFDNMIFQFRGRGNSTTGYLNLSFDNIFLGTFNTAE